jgi:tRNA threonylcarbamoyladenosine biosynthesis protein TsaB
MITLVLDASTYVGDVAVLDDGHVLSEQSAAMKGADEERLMPAVVAALSAANVAIGDVASVVCGAGPGSFTSLRIAGSIAKGIVSGIGASLYAAPSMALIVGGADLARGRYLAVVDALRGEAYVGLYEVCVDDSVIELEEARRVVVGDIDRLAVDLDARSVSPSEQLATIVARPRARAATRIGALISARGPVDLATWEPAYGRLAEAQVRWESLHGKPLPTG